ncbi:hypothetical protein GCM10007860_28000 [Chitiniphilus shinanonensis]|uniref:Uncharacterized protein n=1 Tax=Chitiniphilus shinanonensis TaxID=553088 RepID=A0ABQ6C0D0_9NEIS|nr:hypothetical protein GCM10007860_28000 [Chitiniphilus shinanonensis]
MQRQVEAVAGQPQGDGMADAAIGAGDEDGLAHGRSGAATLGWSLFLTEFVGLRAATDGGGTVRSVAPRRRFRRDPDTNGGWCLVVHGLLGALHPDGRRAGRKRVATLDRARAAPAWSATSGQYKVHGK